MKVFFTKPYRWAVTLAVLLVVSTTGVLLDSFVFPKVLLIVDGGTGTDQDNQDDHPGDRMETGEPAMTDLSYEDENIKINIEQISKNGVVFYVADVELSDSSYLKTALAGDAFGRNITDTTSSIAKAHNAIFAVNGDYYGFRSNGYVLRNGKLLRSEGRSSNDDEALVIDKYGAFSIIRESEVSAASLSDAQQVFSFGPALVINGEAVKRSGKTASQRNPRTAIGQISSLHYLFIVVDGRTNVSAGMTLSELAEELANRGCVTAYNLDGGGSSAMWLNGSVVNNPTDGRHAGEREVSDIVYIGT